MLGVMRLTDVHRGALSIEMIPMLIQQGFRAIAVQFDVWGLSKLIHGSLVQARAAAKQVAAESKGTTNGATE
jgi:4-hydroxy-2-oxoheptanedioate aldolase